MITTVNNYRLGYLRLRWTQVRVYDEILSWISTAVGQFARSKKSFSIAHTGLASRPPTSLINQWRPLCTRRTRGVRRTCYAQISTSYNLDWEGGSYTASKELSKLLVCILVHMRLLHWFIYALLADHIRKCWLTKRLAFPMSNKHIIISHRCRYHNTLARHLKRPGTGITLRTPRLRSQQHVPSAGYYGGTLWKSLAACVAFSLWGSLAWGSDISEMLGEWRAKAFQRELGDGRSSGRGDGFAPRLGSGQNCEAGWRGLDELGWDEKGFTRS